MFSLFIHRLSISENDVSYSHVGIMQYRNWDKGPPVIDLVNSKIAQS